MISAFQNYATLMKKILIMADKSNYQLHHSAGSINHLRHGIMQKPGNFCYLIRGMELAVHHPLSVKHKAKIWEALPFILTFITWFEIVHERGKPLST